MTTEMPTKTITITELDRQRIERLLVEFDARAAKPDEHLEWFRKKFEQATIVSQEEVPADVVTMNSTVNLYDMDFDVTESYTLVYPVNADIFENRVSVLNPLGMAILGHRPGDVARWKNAHGEHQLELRELVFQPEREGVMNL
ncbi:MAG TPA: GreA/GreB family elongation factor [Planctomycetaceae bacterium]|nr:GreA/GreB family elongation factor [Planctomycetaceae bacterium]